MNLCKSPEALICRGVGNAHQPSIGDMDLGLEAVPQVGFQNRVETKTASRLLFIQNAAKKRSPCFTEEEDRFLCNL
jgi:hypothetical protein